MRNKRRLADLPVEEPESTFLGPKMDAMMMVGNQPVELGNLREDPYPTQNPFWRDENILISNRKKSESQGDREARIARRLLILKRRQAGNIKIDGRDYLIRGNFTAKQVRERYKKFKEKYPDNNLTLAQWAVQRGAVYFAKK